MKLREHFEKLHPVPEGVTFAGDTYYAPDSWRWPLAVKQQALWQGFQSGHAAGLERAVDLVKQLDGEVHNLCQKISRKEDEGWEGSKRRCVLHSEAEQFVTESIRAMKEPK